MTTTDTVRLPKGKNFWEDDVDVAIFDARGVRRYDMNQKLWGMNSAVNKNTFLPYDSTALTDAALYPFQARSDSQLGSSYIELDGWEATTLVLAGYLTSAHFEAANETDATIGLPPVNIYERERRITIVAHKVQLFEIYRKVRCP